MTPGRPSPAILLTALALALSGCAGTDPAGDPTSTPAATAPPASAPAPENSSSQGSSSEGSAPAASARAGQRIEVTVTGGQVGGDTGRTPVPLGEAVTLVVTSDVADEVHVHGYDLTLALEPGTPAELPFDATIPGVFQVELHDAGTVLLTLQVS